MDKHYYRAKMVAGDYFLAQVYHYDASGNKIIPVWTSEQSYETKEAAEDAAAVWLEDHPEIDAELDG